MHFSRPRPTPSKPHLGCSPNTPSNPVSMDGVGVDELSGINFCGRAPTHPLSVVDPSNHAAPHFGRRARTGRPLPSRPGGAQGPRRSPAREVVQARQ